MKIVLLSYHIYDSPRKAGFHFLAYELAKKGHQVEFITTGLSLFALIKGFFRLRMAIKLGILNRTKPSSDPGVSERALFSLLHPIPVHSRIPAVQRVMDFIFGTYRRNARKIQKTVTGADLLIVESNSSLILINALKEKIDKKKTKIIYRASDDLETLNANDVTLRAEKELLESGAVDLVSCPSDAITEKLSRYHPRVRTHQHGLDLQLFDSCETNPYPPGTVNAVYAGFSHFDYQVFEALVTSCPKVNFYIFGIPQKRFSGAMEMPGNLFWAGETPFAELIPYIKHADVALQLRTTPNSDLKHSLKIQQYTYCGLPIVGPRQLDTGWGNFFGYQSGDPESAVKAFREALDHGPCGKAKSYILSWTQVTENILRDLPEPLSDQ